LRVHFKCKHELEIKACWRSSKVFYFLAPVPARDVGAHAASRKSKVDKAELVIATKELEIPTSNLDGMFDVIKFRAQPSERTNCA